MWKKLHLLKDQHEKPFADWQNLCCMPCWYWVLHCIAFPGNIGLRLLLMAMLLANTAKHFCQNQKMLCFYGVNLINHSKGKNLKRALQSAWLFFLGTPKHTEIYFGERNESTPDWTSWVILQLLYFSNAGALVEICTPSSLTPVISLGYTNSERRHLQKCSCLVTVTRSSHRKREYIFHQGNPRSQRRKSDAGDQEAMGAVAFCRPSFAS